jgi:AcrR family transcriptional regulator
LGDVPQLRTAPRQRRSQQSIDAILDAAERLIHVHGQVAFTANELAAEAGMSIGRVYYWYPDIPAVVKALVKRAVSRLVATYSEIATDDAADDTSVLIKRTIEALCDYIDANPGAVALCLSGDPQTGPGGLLRETLVDITSHLLEFSVPDLPRAEIDLVAQSGVAIVLGMLRGYVDAGDSRPFVRQELIYILTSWMYCRFPPAGDRVWTDHDFPIRPSAPASPSTAVRTFVYPALVAPSAD